MLQGFKPVPGNNAGSFIGAPCRVVLHTTEGASAAGAIGAYRANNSWPHFTVDCQTRDRYQHLELDVAARALLHPPASVETNRANAIQIEIVGFAALVPNWSKANLEWLAHEVLEPIREVSWFALTAARFVAYPQSAGTGAAQRFSPAAWLQFSGICGHEHVPGNDHGDPGLLDTTTILAALSGPPLPIPHRRHEMFVVQLESNKGTEFYHVHEGITGVGVHIWRQANTLPAALQVCNMIGQNGPIPTIPDDLYHEYGGN